jgi:hypothetical protein
MVYKYTVATFIRELDLMQWTYCYKIWNSRQLFIVEKYHAR